ncbi:MAG: sulfur carrier protein ThiS [Verrucomicrobiae bacterium]
MITVNGEELQTQAATVSGLVGEMDLPAPLLLIELNGIALRKSEWESTAISEGDRMEILRISAGG